MTDLQERIVIDSTSGRSLTVLPEEPRGSGGNQWFSAQYTLIYFLIGVIVIWILSGFYQVGVGEVGVVERLGQYLTLPNGQPELSESGLHYHLPWPIDKVHIIPLNREHLLEVADFDTSPASYANLRKKYMRQGIPRRVVDAIFNPYLITGDKNILHARISVQYEINNPMEYLLSVYQPAGEPRGSARDAAIRMLASHQLISQLAHDTVDEALYNKLVVQRQLSSQNASDGGGLQAAVKAVKLGITVKRVQLEYVHWPRAVNAAFTAALTDRQEEALAIQDALRQSDTVMTEAQGQAQAIVSSAQAQASRTISEASAEAQKFTSVYRQYVKHPRVITLKLIADTLGKVMQNARRVFFVQPGQRMLLSLPPPPKKASAVVARQPGD
ncbi:MAG: protease modulator HflK [Phycisphaerae bacterium]